MKKILSLVIIAALMFSLAGCAGSLTGGPTYGNYTPPDESQVSKGDLTPSGDDADFDGVSLNVGFLKGPTGMGASYFMEQAENGEYPIEYDITVEADPSAVVSAVISGTIDIAAVPTNVAASLYNKTGGAVRIAAVNTLGVLKILENGSTVSSVSDLEGKTVYATGQGSNPEYVLNYILRANGLEPGVDVKVEYMASDELTTRMASGSVDICMLPVPAATTVLVKNADVRVALDLTEQWETAAGGDSVLTQGCIVFRYDKVTSAAMDEFLRSYSESIEWMTDSANIDEAAALAVKYGIVGAEPIAKAAIPDCGMVFAAGAELMQSYLGGYFDVLMSAEPGSIGGSIPGDDFYYNYIA